MKRTFGGLAVLVAVLALASALAVKWWPARGVDGRRPALAAVPPLPSVTRSSVVVTPVAIALTAIQEAVEKVAPRELAGKSTLPAAPAAGGPDIGWSLTRGALVLSGRAEGVSLSTSLRGSSRATAPMAAQGGPPAAAPGAFPGLILPPIPMELVPPALRPPGLAAQGGRGGQQPSEQRADIEGNIILTARPTLLSGWRIEPNLTSQVTIGDASLAVMGMKLNVSNDMKPALERTIREQVDGLQTRIAGDPFLEQAAREQWSKMCRSIPLGAVAPGMPDLWLELRPVRALAGQPRIDASAVTLTIGMQAEARIVPARTLPDCPFPPQLEIVPQMEQGRIGIDLPIDIPFSELARLIEAQMAGRAIPEADAPLTATVRKVDLAASGDRLLLSLGVTVREAKSWLGLAADATIHVWGRPVLDPGRRILRFRDIGLDVESAAAFGALGAAARTAVPSLERALAEQAVIDLGRLAADARRNVEAALAEFRGSIDGVRVDAAIVDLRLSDIAFDARTLRVIGEADGTVRVAVSRLPER